MLSSISWRSWRKGIRRKKASKYLLCMHIIWHELMRSCHAMFTEISAIGTKYIILLERNYAHHIMVCLLMTQLLWCIVFKKWCLLERAEGGALYLKDKILIKKSTISSLKFQIDLKMWQDTIRHRHPHINTLTHFPISTSCICPAPSKLNQNPNYTNRPYI